MIMESLTWNTRHFAGKTELPVLTPAEWLEQFAGEQRELCPIDAVLTI